MKRASARVNQHDRIQIPWLSRLLHSAQIDTSPKRSRRERRAKLAKPALLRRDASRHSASARACALTLALLLSASDEISARGWTIFDLSESLNSMPPTSAQAAARIRRHWQALAKLAVDGGVVTAG
jgi:hypothetical protein